MALKDTNKGKLIYQPQGPAGEYAKWAVNLHNGCTHGCTYCYNNRGFMSHAFGTEPKLAAPICKKAKRMFDEWYDNHKFIDPDFVEEHREDFFYEALNEIITDDIEKISAERLRNDGGVFFSFKCDPLAEQTKYFTVCAVNCFFKNNIPVTILTKSTEWYNNNTLRGLSESNKDLLTIGFTLTGMDDMEVNAPSTKERLDVLRKVHDMGIKTFVSLEPVIDIKKAMKVIKECNGLADEIRIGVQSPIKKNRYDVRELEAFVAFLHRLVHFEDFHSVLTIKRSLCHQIDYLPAAFRRECAGLITEIWMNQQTE